MASRRPPAADDAFGDGGGVVALQPLADASPRAAARPAGPARWRRRRNSTRREEVEVRLGEAFLVGRVHVQDAEHVVLRPERRAHEGADALQHEALGRVDAPVLRHVGREHRRLVAHDGAEHRPADVDVARAGAAARAADRGTSSPECSSEQQEHAAAATDSNVSATIRLRISDTRRVRASTPVASARSCSSRFARVDAVSGISAALAPHAALRWMVPWTGRRASAVLREGNAFLGLLEREADLAKGQDVTVHHLRRLDRHAVAVRVEAAADVGDAARRCRSTSNGMAPETLP